MVNKKFTDRGIINMKIIALGNQGLKIPAVGLGCMGMSDFYGDSDTQKNLKVLDYAAEIGCTFWDTSDIYGPFTNEELLSKPLSQRREAITLATKFGIQRDTSGNWLGVSGHPDYVKASCEASLKRLGTDYIDLYYQHRMDPNVPIEDTVGAMSELVEQGKVKYLGLSEASPELLERAYKVHPISALQTEYSLWSREVEADILPTCEKLGIGFVAYSPLGRGFLTGAITKRDDLQADDWRLSNPRFQQDAMEHNQKMVAKIANVAADKNVTSAQIALAWLLSKKPEIAMIPGTRQERYLEQNWKAMDIVLTTDEIENLNKLSNENPALGDRY